MIDLRLFKNRIFSISLITGFLTFFTIAGTIILMPFYLENSLGYETRQVGLLLAVVPIAMGIISPISGTLSDRFGTRIIAVFGLVILLTGYISLSQLKLETGTVEYILRFLPVGLGMGIFQSPNNSTIMGSAPKGRLGIVSGMLAINRTIGQTTGIAILGAFWASRVSLYNQEPMIISATDADSFYQVLGLRTTFMLISIIILIALGFSIWGLIIERSNVNASRDIKSRI
jgi:MFS family permease